MSRYRCMGDRGHRRTCRRGIHQCDCLRGGRSRWFRRRSDNGRCRNNELQSASPSRCWNGRRVNIPRLDIHADGRSGIADGERDFVNPRSQRASEGERRRFARRQASDDVHQFRRGAVNGHLDLGGLFYVQISLVDHVQYEIHLPVSQQIRASDLYRVCGWSGSGYGYACRGNRWPWRLWGFGWGWCRSMRRYRRWGWRACRRDSWSR